MLRHTAAKLRREAGASIEQVSAFLGHSSIATTAIYLRRLAGWQDDHWADVSRLLSIPIGNGWPAVEARAGPPNEWPSERGNAHPADWQGGPEHGATLPATYSTSAAVGPASPTIEFGAMTPMWRDDRISLLKSALQKYIRRGEADNAYAVAHRLLTLPGGRSALARRLPVIAAEDVGVAYIPAASGSGNEPSDDADLLRVTTGLSVLPKSKEAYWLAATVWENRLPIGSLGGETLRDALEAGDHRGAVAMALAAREQRAWRSGERLISVLQHALASGPTLGSEIGLAALRREAKGGFGTGELMAAAVIAAIDKPQGPTPTLPSVAAPSQPRLELAWFVADGHTSIGQRALRRVALRRGLRPTMVANLMFCFSSVVLGPTEIPSRWQAEAREMDATAYGWGTHSRGSRLWEALQSEVAAEIQQALTTVRL